MDVDNTANIEMTRKEEKQLLATIEEVIFLLSKELTKLISKELTKYFQFA